MSTGYNCEVLTLTESATCTTPGLIIEFNPASCTEERSGKETRGMERRGSVGQCGAR